MTEKQLKYMNKIKAISFFILVAGLILVLVWSIMNKNASKPKEEEIPAKVLAINYDKNGEKAKYDFTCATQDCILSSQAGSYALVKDGSYKLVNLSNGSNKELQLPTMAKNFMVAGDTFYGLVFTADQTNKASFYDATTGETMYASELNYEKMNEQEVRDVLNKMYPRKLFFIIKEELGTVMNTETKEAIIDNVKAVFYHENALYAIDSKGLSLFKEDNSLEEKITGVKEVYNAIYKENILILDTDNKIKTSTLTGEKGDTILELGEGKVESLNISNGILRITVQDKDYETNKKLVKYEYDFEAKKLTPIE